MTSIRVVGYNIRALRDDEDAVVRVLRGLRPDIVCLQEVPRFPYQVRHKHRLARRCGLALVPGRRKAGLAIMLGERVRLMAAQYHLLPRVPGLHLRGLAVAAVEIEGVRLIAASTHLDLETEARKAHTAEVVSLLDRARRTYEAPVVLCGDFNEEPDGPSWAMLAKAFQDGYAVAPAGEELTFSAAKPYKRIDAIFADHQLAVTGCGVPADPVLAEDYAAATDHRPLLAEISF
jgi:endonuclease/exonuclease/phosphatase family metal-dependent hydrolase